MTFAESLRKYRFFLLAMAVPYGFLYARVVPDMVRQWYHDDNYSHGFLVPLISAWFIYERREALLKAAARPWNPGWAVLLFGLGQLLAGRVMTEYFTMRSSMVTVLCGVILILFGREVFRLLLFPLAYLLFMVPIPAVIYNSVAFPLKLFVTRLSVGFMKLIGIVVVREGNIIMFPSVTLEVVDACSGIRSLLSLLVIGVAYAFFLQISPLRRAAIIFSAVPIAIIINGVRVIITGILAQHFGGGAAEGFFHEFTGMAVFVVSMLLLFAVGAVIKGKERSAE
jgi:exosortase